MIIKHIPEDFRVDETTELKPTGNGQYNWFKLTKKGHTTIGALERIGRVVGAPLKAFGYAGSKDRQAITTQTCSVKNKTVNNIQLDGIQTLNLGQSDRPISLGMHTGNDFNITIRDLDKMPTIPTRFLNLFGEQRFGKNNAEIGKYIVNKNFQKAIDKILETGCDEREQILRHLENNPKDHTGALRKIPLKKLKIYIHAYQSEIWNKTAQKAKTETTLPIIGFGTEEIPWIAEEEMQWEGITPRDFLIKEIPDLSAEGDERDVWCEPRKLKTGQLQDDEHFAGKKKLTISFWLPKGSYATTFIANFT